MFNLVFTPQGQAKGLGPGLGNDILCPTCAGVRPEYLWQAANPNPTSTPIGVSSSVDSDAESVATIPSTNDVLPLAQRASGDHVIEDSNGNKKQHFPFIHYLLA
jgi:hypothetical protein